MQTCVISISEILKDLQHNLSAGYWIDKKKRDDKGFDAILKEEQRKLENK